MKWPLDQDRSLARASNAHGDQVEPDGWMTSCLNRVSALRGA
jgi:hypothetical protein